MHSGDKRRRRIAVAACTANVAGAGSGFLASTLGMDPHTSVLIGAFVGGTVADGLFQLVTGPRAAGGPEAVRGEDVGPEPVRGEDVGREAVGRGARLPDGLARDGLARDVQAPHGHVPDGRGPDHPDGRERPAPDRHRPRAGSAARTSGYARCRRPHGAHDVDLRHLFCAAAAPPAAEPRHARHRRLYRGGQRHVQRAYGYRSGRPAAGNGHGTA
ncbi:hypothetical protein [Streptomyces sp. NPDC047928]|uniref:hypothetical protein n=1 Tax=unclassified Streptomyces TaxID=2593676 RepID=UPI00371EA395